MVSNFFSKMLADEAGHMPALTGLRGFAAIWVYLYHVWGLSGHQEFIASIGAIAIDFTPLISMGGAGVSIFFVLSGFLLSLPFAEWQAGLRERPKTGRFIVRRILRVFPAYYAQLAILLCVALVTSGVAATPDGITFLRYLLMLFVPPPIGVSPLNGVWWTLPIEFSFYLVLPLLFFFLKPGNWLWLLVISWLTMWSWRYAVIAYLGESPVPLIVISTYQLPGAFDMFGMGMLTAVIYTHRAALPAWLNRFINSEISVFLGILLIAAAAYWLAGNRDQYWANNAIFYLWTPLLSLGTALIILAGTSKSSIASALFGNRWMIFAGLISYSVYLWHFPVLEWLYPWLNRNEGTSFGLMFIISFPLIVLVSMISYLMVERPAMRYR